MFETRECARFLQEIRSPPIEGLLVALRSRLDAHGGNAFTEIVRIIFLDCDACAEPDVFGLVCDAEASRPHNPQDAIALIEYGTFWQNYADVQGGSPISTFFPQNRFPCKNPAITVSEPRPSERQRRRKRECDLIVEHSRFTRNGNIVDRRRRPRHHALADRSVRTAPCEPCNAAAHALGSLFGL